MPNNEYDQEYAKSIIYPDWETGSSATLTKGIECDGSDLDFEGHPRESNVPVALSVPVSTQTAK